MKPSSRLRFVLTISILISCPVGSPAATARVSGAAAAFNEENLMMIEDRGLHDYADDLGRGFTTRLSELGPNDLWIDFGCGQAEAVKQYLLAPSPRFWGPPKASAQSLATKAQVLCLGARPLGADERLTRIHEFERKLGRTVLHAMTGRLLHEIPAGEIARMTAGKPRVLISDVKGILSYTRDFKGDFERIMAEVPIGTVMLFWLSRESFRVSSDPLQRGRPSRAEDLEDVFGRANGLALEDVSGHFFYTVIVRKTELRVTLPNLATTMYVDDRPALPQRTIVVEGEPPCDRRLRNAARPPFPGAK